MPEDVKLDKTTINAMEKLQKTKKIDFLGKNFSGKQQALAFLKTADAVEALRIKTKKLTEQNKKTEEEFKKQQKKLKAYEELMKKGKITTKQYTELQKKFEVKMKSLRSCFQKTTEELKKQNIELGKTSAKYKEQKRALEEMIESEGAYIALLNSKNVVLRKVGSLFTKGKEEVEEYTEAIEKSGGKSIVFGAAAYYMAEKISELGEKLEETAKSFAVFDIRMASLSGATLIAPGGVEQLKEIRSELYLTTADFQEFTDIAIEGVNNGVTSMEGMVGSIEKLHETFGRNQFEKLKEMVELIKSIPTLDTDININAKMDDQAASWFALAKKGKVTEAIELQNAGLLGGEKKELEGADKQIEVLKGLHHAEKLLEDIKRYGADAYVYFGALGPEVSMISSTLLTIGAGLGGLVTFAGGMRSILGKLVEKKEETAIRLAIEEQQGADKANTKALMNRFAVDTNRVVRAIISKQDVGGSSVGIDETGKKGAKGAQGKSGRLSKLNSLGGKLSIGGMVASLIATPAIGALEEHYKKSGNKTGENLAHGAGTAMGIGGYAATGAMVGTFGGPIGTAIGGAIGAGIGIYANWEDVTETSTKLFSKENEVLKSVIEAREKEKMSILASQEARQRSALEMQKFLKMIENTANTEKTSLVNEQLETFGKELENLENIGGTVDNFNEIIAGSADSLKDKFKLLSDGFEEVRKKIYEDAKLNGIDRKNMLMMLHKKELEAVKQFAEGMLGLVGEFDKIPEIIVNKLQNTISKTKIDLGVQTSGISRDTMFSELDKVIGNLTDNMKIVFDQYGKDMLTTNDSLNEITNKNKQMKETIKSGIEEVGGNWGKELKNVFSFDEKTGDMKIDDNSKNKLNKTVDGILESFETDIDKLNELPKLLKEEKDLREETVKSAEHSIAKKTLTSEHASDEDKEKAKEAIKEPSRNVSDVMEEQIKKKKEIVKHMKEHYLTQKDIGKSDDEIYELAKEQAQTNREEVKFTSEKMINVQKTSQILKETNKLLNSGVEYQKQVNKSTLALYDNVKEFIDTIEELSNLVGKSVESQNATANLELLSAQADSYVNAGILTKLSNNLLSANIASNEEQVKDLNEAYKRLEEMEKITKDKEAFVKKTRENFKKLTDEMNKDFTDGNVFSKENLSKEIGKVGEELHSNIVNMIYNATKINELTNKKEGTTNEDEKASIDKEIAEKSKNNIELEKKANELMAKSTMGAEHKEYLKTKMKELKTEANAETAYKAIVDKIGLEKYQLSKSSADLANQMIKLVDMIADIPSKIDESLNIKSFSGTRDAANALADLATESWNVSEAVKQSNIGLENSRKIYEEQKRQLDELSNPESMKKTFDALAEQYQKMIDNAKTPEDKANAEKALESFKLNGEELIIAKQKVKLAEAEKKYKDDVVSSAKRIRQSEEERVDMQAGLVSDTISYMEEMGASVGDIMAMRRQEIAIAAQKIPLIEKELAAYQDAFDQAVASGDKVQEAAMQKNIEEKRTELVKQQMDLQKKALGAQRDAYEKMLGLAFGEIRQARGARKGMMSEASIYGRGYVKQSGTDMVIANSAGQSQTLDERSKQYQNTIGGVKSMKELKGEVEGIVGANLGTENPSKVNLTPMDGSGIGMPTLDKKEVKNKKEELKLDIKGNKNKKEENKLDNKDIQEQKSPILDLPSYDNKNITSTVELSQKQLSVQEEIRDILSNTNTMNTTQQSVLEQNKNTSLIGLQSSSGTNVAYTSAKGFEQFDRKPTQIEQKNPMENTTATTAQITVTGEVTVKFDNKMFEQTVINLVSTNTTIANSLINRFDSRYVQA